MMRGMTENGLRPATLAVVLGRPPGPGDPLGPPIELTSTYRAGGEDIYGRDGNATWRAFEAVLGALEGGRALAFASGLAAVSAVVESLPVGAAKSSLKMTGTFSALRRSVAFQASRPPTIIGFNWNSAAKSRARWISSAESASKATGTLLSSTGQRASRQGSATGRLPVRPRTSNAAHCRFSQPASSIVCRLWAMMPISALG